MVLKMVCSYFMTVSFCCCFVLFVLTCHECCAYSFSFFFSCASAKPVIISHNGASGIYPGSTDLAYQQAVDDGADIIDCSVQMTSDGVPVCLGTINLVDSSTVVESSFNDRLSSIPGINGGASGVFTFNLTWNEIKSLHRELNLASSLHDLSLTKI